MGRESWNDLIKNYGLRTVIVVSVRELVNPSEGCYSTPGPSGISWYIGPPLIERITKRLERGEKNGR